MRKNERRCSQMSGLPESGGHKAVARFQLCAEVTQLFPQVGRLEGWSTLRDIENHVERDAVWHLRSCPGSFSLGTDWKKQYEKCLEGEQKVLLSFAAGITAGSVAGLADVRSCQIKLVHCRCGEAIECKVAHSVCGENVDSSTQCVIRGKEWKRWTSGGGSFW